MVHRVHRRVIVRVDVNIHKVIGRVLAAAILLVIIFTGRFDAPMAKLLALFIR